MVTPPVTGHDKGTNHLDALDALLAESLLVEHARGLLEVGVREEGLHAFRG